MKKVFSVIIFSLLLISTIGCKSNEPAVKSENPASKFGVGLDVFATGKRTNVRATFEKSPELEGVQIEFNGKELSGIEEQDGRINFAASFENYDKVSQFLITASNGKQYKFEATVEPVDFQTEEPFTFHRLKANEIKLSRPFTETDELWLSIFDSYLGGFKEIAEFNSAKDAVVIPESVSKRMSVGEAKISLYNVEIKSVENDLFDGNLHVSYESEIKMKVVK